MRGAIPKHGRNPKTPLSTSDMMEFFRTKYQRALATLTRAEPDQSFVDDWNSIAFAP